MKNFELIDRSISLDNNKEFLKEELEREEKNRNSIQRKILIGIYFIGMFFLVFKAPEIICLVAIISFIIALLEI